ncbi:MAG: phenylalanine--tRNA ligase subunit beta [Candidatus Woesearchaeota archaeon]|nr:phenylalanine--tRNA ligase subunit beta [Candidatus Woesearchaeota archaeon]
MPAVTLNKDVFERLVGKKLPLEKLKERISYMGTDLESIEENEINVEVFPNRPDMLSEQGFVRAFSTFIGASKGIKRYDVKRSGEKVIIDKSVKNVRPFTACAIVKGLKFNDEKIREIIQIQEKLHVTYGRNRKRVAIGIYPFEKITPPIKFIAKRPEEIKFRPLEGKKEMTGRQILSQHPTGREYAHLLEGLDEYPVFVDANGEVLSMPPIINSHDVGKITENTKEVFIECSGFYFDVLSTCINIIVTALADMGGKIYSMDLIYPDKKTSTPNLAPRKIKTSRDYINKILGLRLNDSEIKKALERMGFNYKKGVVSVPAYRADILHQIDIAEDVAIAYGYDNFKEEPTKVSTIGEPDKFNSFCSKIADVIVGIGMIETNTYCLIDKDMQTKMCSSKMEVIELIDPVSKDYNSLRTWLIPSMLNVLKDNKHNEYPQDIFHIGAVFKRYPSTESGTTENFRLCIALCSQKADFTAIKSVLDYIFKMLDVTYYLEDAEHASFIRGRVGRVMFNNEKIAYVGEISPEVLSNFELTMPVACLELNLTELFRLISE